MKKPGLDFRGLIGNRTHPPNMEKPQLNATALVRMIKEGAVSLMGPWPEMSRFLSSAWVITNGAGASVLSPIRVKLTISQKPMRLLPRSENSTTFLREVYQPSSSTR